jgi:hypothetical protein
LQCAIHGIAGCAKQFAAPPPIALSLFQNFFRLRLDAGLLVTLDIFISN